jgi:hypothetical protein
MPLPAPLCLRLRATAVAVAAAFGATVCAAPLHADTGLRLPPDASTACCELPWLLAATDAAIAEAGEPSAYAPEATSPAVDAARQARIRNKSILLLSAGVAGIYLFGLATWWQDGFTGSFTSTREGWFGPDTAHGGQDKLGHFMFTYAGARLLTWGLESFGNDRDTAIWLGAATSWFAQSGVEIIDGFSQKWSFSREDFLMNTAGAAAAVALEKYPDLDALIDFRFNYWPSTTPDGQRREWAPFSDYSGQTYHFVTKASGIGALGQVPVVKYLELNLGYGARGFEDGGERARYTYVGLSLNMSKLLNETVLKNSGPKTRKVSDNLFEYVQFQTFGVWNERRF